jgi:hypothetical protein
MRVSSKLKKITNLKYYSKLKITKIVFQKYVNKQIKIHKIFFYDF